jgi:xanthine dehydrogenase accessory factor
MNLFKTIQKILQEGSTATLATIVDEGKNIGAKLLIDSEGNLTGDLGNEELNKAVADCSKTFLSSHAETITVEISETRIMFERIEPEPRLVICGAGHVGAALARLSALVGYEVSLIDDRAEFVSNERFTGKNIFPIATKDWSSDIKTAIGTGRGVSVAIVTRGHKEDELCLHAALESKPDYVGMIGSKRRTRIVISHLREEGVDEKLLESVYAPIGLDIGAVSPEEVALAILAEIITVRRGGTCLPLSQKTLRKE